MYKKWKFTILGLLIILGAALFIRIYRLDLIPVFVDEAIYIRWAQVMRAESTLRFLPLSDGKQPLFMWAVMPALKVIADPLIAGRVVSVATGLGTTIGVFALSYTLFKSRKAALFASLLYGLSPFAVFFDRMALVDSMLAFFGVWTLTFSVLAVKNLRLDLAMIAGFFMGGAWLTKSPALFFWLMLPASLLFIPQSRKKSKLITLIHAGMLLGVVLLISYAMYNVLRLGPNFHLIGSRNLDYVHPYTHILQSPLDPFLPHIDRALEWFETMGPSAVILLVLGAIVANFQRFKKEIIILLIWGMLPVVIEAEFSRVFTSRYIFFVLPPIFVLAGSIIKKYKFPPFVYVSYGLVFLFLAQALLFYLPFFHKPEESMMPERDGYLSDWTGGYGIREAAGIITQKRNANQDKEIVVGTEGYFGTLPDGLQIYLEKEPNITVIGVGIDLLEVPESLTSSAAAGNITYLLANRSRLRFGEPFDQYGLRKVAAFEKPTQKDGTHDTMYLLEVLP